MIRETNSLYIKKSVRKEILNYSYPISSKPNLNRTLFPSIHLNNFRSTLNWIWGPVSGFRPQWTSARWFSRSCCSSWELEDISVVQVSLFSSTPFLSNLNSEYHPLYLYLSTFLVFPLSHHFDFLSYPINRPGGQLLLAFRCCFPCGPAKNNFSFAAFHVLLRGARADCDIHRSSQYLSKGPGNNT